MEVVGPLKNQLNVILDLAQKQIDAGDTTCESETLREILRTQKKHLDKLTDIISKVLDVENSKFERLLNSSQASQLKTRNELDSLTRMRAHESQAKVSKLTSKTRLSKLVSESPTKSKARLTILPQRAPVEMDGLETLSSLQKNLQKQVLQLERLANPGDQSIDDPIGRVISLRIGEND
jgi:hypothetical protein